MSAWIVSREHVDLMLAAGLPGPRPGVPVSPNTVSSGLRWFSEQPDRAGGMSEYERVSRTLTRETADEVGRMLWLENVASVAERYPDDGPNDRPGPVSFCDAEAETYTYTDPGYRLTPGEVLNAVSCYEYQSCEHAGWDESEAKRYCAALREDACSELATGPWGWDADEIAKARAARSLIDRPTTVGDVANMRS